MIGCGRLVVGGPMNNVINFKNHKDKKEVEKRFSINATMKELSNDIGDVYSKLLSKHPEFDQTDLKREFIFLLVKHSAILAGRSESCKCFEVVDRWNHYYEASRRNK
jgi:hypothetical protein